MRESPRKPSMRATAAPAVREVRAVVVCRPPIAYDARRLGGDTNALAELEIRSPASLPADTPDADLCRDITVAKGILLRMPLYGYLGGAEADQLCEREVAPLLQRLLAGESSAIVAYGQTGSGKSYTMGTERYTEGQGPAAHSVGAFCARSVFELAQERGVRDLEVSFAAIEIYREGKDKERLFDLQTLERKRIESFETQVSWQRVGSPQDLQRKLLDASFLRNTDRTDGNGRSSRSHAIFVTQVQFKRQQEEGGGVQRIKARLMLVDLAGSERASLAAAGSTTQKQGSGINVGLLYLGMIIKELAERGQTLNYRMSALTEILKPALGGGANELTSSCNTLIVGCISPLTVHSNNTKSTLEFLQQAGTVKNLVRADVQMLRQQELEAQVEFLQKKVMQLELERQQHRAHQPGPSGAAPAAGVEAGSLEQDQEPPPSPGREGRAGSDDGSSAGEGVGASAAAAAAAEERAAALERELAALRRDLVEQRDRADAYEAQLRQHAKAAAAEAEAAAASGAGAGAAGQDGTPAPLPGSAGTAAAAAAAVPGATPATARWPSAASFLAAASPLLAASRGVADWVADAAAAEAATPAGQRLPLLQLLPGAEEICCERDSHMEEDELAALKDKVERLLNGARDGDERQQARAFAEACLYALGAYNKCLGDAVTRAEDAAEDAETERRQAECEFSQLFEEKAVYMRRTSAAEAALANYEIQIEDLQARLATALETLQQRQATPGRWSSLSRLITGSGGGASVPPARSPGTIDSRRTSHSGSPAASPRAGLSQMLFGSPSRMAQLHGPSGSGSNGGGSVGKGATGAGAAAAAAAQAGDSPEERRVTVACVQTNPGGQHEAAAAAATQALLERQRCKAAASLLPRLSPQPKDGQQKQSEQQQQQQLGEEQQVQQPDLIKAMYAPPPACSGGPRQPEQHDLQQQQPQQQGQQEQQQQQPLQQELNDSIMASPLPMPHPGMAGKQLAHEHAAASPPHAPHGLAAVQEQQQQQCQEGEPALKEPQQLAPDAAGEMALEAAVLPQKPAQLSSLEQLDLLGQESGDVETPLESPEVSCILAGGTTSSGEGDCGGSHSREHALQGGQLLSPPSALEPTPGAAAAAGAAAPGAASTPALVAGGDSWQAHAGPARGQAALRVDAIDTALDVGRAGGEVAPQAEGVDVDMEPAEQLMQAVEVTAEDGAGPQQEDFQQQDDLQKQEEQEGHQEDLQHQQGEQEGQQGLLSEMSVDKGGDAPADRPALEIQLADAGAAAGAGTAAACERPQQLLPQEQQQWEGHPFLQQVQQPPLQEEQNRHVRVGSPGQEQEQHPAQQQQKQQVGPLEEQLLHPKVEPQEEESPQQSDVQQQVPQAPVVPEEQHQEQELLPGSEALQQPAKLKDEEMDSEAEQQLVKQEHGPVLLSAPPQQQAQQQLPPNPDAQQQLGLGHEEALQPAKQEDEQALLLPPSPQPPLQQQQQAPLLPGPTISVRVPPPGRQGSRGGCRAGRRGGASSWPVFDFCPATSLFYVPETEEALDALHNLALPDGEPWQRHVVLSGSDVTLEQWLLRRMLRQGRCHFCCSKAPEPSCSHPEDAFANLQLCQGCYMALEPASWCKGEWLSDNPEDPGFKWCCLCGGAGAGCTDKLVMCSTCKVHGFCSGCLWRFTADDLAAVEQAASWECPLCRPAPKLQFVYAEERASSSRAARSRHASVEPEAAAAAAAAGAAATGLRRSTRPRVPPRQLQQEQQRGRSATPDIVIDLSGSTSGSSSDGQSEAEEGRAGRARQAQRGRGKSQAPAARKLGGATAKKAGAPAAKAQRAATQSGGTQAAVAQAGPGAAASTGQQAQPAAGGGQGAQPAAGGGQGAQPAAESGHGAQPAAEGGHGAQPAATAGGQAQPGARKRHRLLAHGDLNESPGVDGDVYHRRRMQQQRQRLGAARPQLLAMQQSQRESQAPALRSAGFYFD